MASQNDSVLSNNSYDTNPINCNNNESETSSSSSVIATHHHYHHGLPSGSASQQKSEAVSKNSIERNYSGGDTGNCVGDCRNIRATLTTNMTGSVNEGQNNEQHTRREENPFSFKHFLNRDTSSSSSVSTNINSNLTLTNLTNATTTSTATTSPIVNELNLINSNNNSSHPDQINVVNNKSSSSSVTIATTTKSEDSQSTVGASSNSISNAIKTTRNKTSSPSMSFKISTGARPKVPQSTSSSTNYNYTPSTSISTTSMSSLIGGSSGGGTSTMKRSPRFSSFDSQASLAEYAESGLNGSGNGTKSDNSDLIDRGATTSMSNFLSQTGYNSGNNCNLVEDSRQQQQYVHRSFSNYDMDLPPSLSKNDGSSGLISPRRRNSPIRPTNRSNSNVVPQSSNKNYPGGSGGGCARPPNSEFSNVLPDFVQDHWMDQWYYNDMNLSSPPNSPISPSPVDFVEDLPGVGGNGGMGGIGSNVGDKCQTLPDFLSDGPIIHSSSRLADVAAGLPPDLDSPEDNSPSLQLSRLRLENDRLRRELDESRLALAEQTRRASELERRLEQTNRHNSEAAAAAAAGIYSRNLTSQNPSGGENFDENLDQSKKHAAAAQSQVTKLKQQVKQLTAEVETLRRENESLREDGAVGGDRVTRRPSRTQQLSRDLMRAASNAENNLRQLLSGVENLRLMAATIENMDRIANDSTNQPHSIFNDECISDSDIDFDNFNGL